MDNDQEALEEARRLKELYNQPDPQFVSRVQGIIFEHELQGQFITENEAKKIAEDEKLHSPEHIRETLNADEYAKHYNLYKKQPEKKQPDQDLSSADYVKKYGLKSQTEWKQEQDAKWRKHDYGY